jgi:hypothetical protein
MKRFSINVAWLAIFVLTSLFIGWVVDTRIAELIGTSITSKSLPPSRIFDSRTQVPVLAAFNGLSMSFEPNRGQTEERVKFLSRANGYTLFFTDSEAILVLREGVDASRDLPSQPEAVRLKFVGANPAANIIGLDPLPGKSNYFIGSNSHNWQTEVSHYRRVRYESIYPGIDLIFYGNRQQLEFDFVVFPGADPNVIQIAVEGTEHPVMDSLDTVMLRSGSGEIRLRQPIAYQIEDGLKRKVYGHYEIAGTNRIAFGVSGYNPQTALVIDPVLDFSTYLGGRKADQANAIAVDTMGNVYIAGRTSSLDFPTTLGSFQSVARRKGGQEVFVTKLDPTGSTLVYSTYLGGTSKEWASGIAVDADGSVYITGVTSSKDFPITFGAFQTVLQGSEDIFVTKLNSTGTGLVYSTYLGGSCANKKSTTEYAEGIAVDLTGNAYVAGSSSCGDFPTTFAAFQLVGNGGRDAVVAKINPLGNGLLYSTYLGGKNDDHGNGIALDADRNVYVTGYTDSPDFPTTPGVLQPARPGGGDSFVMKINAAGSAPIYSTYLGGRKSNKDISGQRLLGFDWAEAISVDAAGHAYVTGETDSVDFPVTPGSFQPTYGGGSSDGFFTKLSVDGASLIFSTYLGGRSGGGITGEGGLGIAVDALENAYVVGGTTASNFPTTANAFQPLFGKGGDGFVVKLNPEGSAIFSSYLGGRGKDQITGVAVDPAGNAYVTGYTSSKDFPTRNALQPVLGRSSDAFVTKIVD